MHEIEPYVHITYIVNNEMDTRHVVYRDIPAEKIRSLFPTISTGTARKKEQWESK
jgi:hypothetical protein